MIVLSRHPIRGRKIREDPLVSQARNPRRLQVVGLPEAGFVGLGRDVARTSASPSPGIVARDVFRTLFNITVPGDSSMTTDRPLEIARDFVAHQSIVMRN